ncbi:MAG: HAD family hydrolase [Candidatus Methanofastidiosia archaeon]
MPTIIFDLDDTLCNTWEASRRANLKLIPYFLRKRKFKLAHGILFGGKPEILNDEKLLPLEAFDFIKILLGLYEDDVEDSFVREIETRFNREFYQHLRLFEDVEEILGKLKEKGFFLSLVTDGGSKTQRKKLEFLGIKDYFDRIIISGEVGTPKTNPKNFELAKIKGKTFVVGDRIKTDIKSGKLIGATTILVANGPFNIGREETKPDFVIENLRELVEIV